VSAVRESFRVVDRCQEAHRRNGSHAKYAHQTASASIVDRNVGEFGVRSGDLLVQGFEYLEGTFDVLGKAERMCKQASPCLGW
jgi:hypothetical protein